MELATVFDVANALGLFAFAISGVYRGLSKKLDLFGVSTLGFLTALGGGIIRDVLLNRKPQVFIGYGDVLITFFGVLFSLTVLRFWDFKNSTALKLSDAVGLSAFALSGAVSAWQSGMNVVGITVLATLTGTGGGMLSDVLRAEIPMVLKEDVYATCAALCGLVFFVCVKFLPLDMAALAAFLAALFLRFGAIIWNWHLPRP